MIKSQLLMIRMNSQMGFLCLGQLEQASLFQNLRAEGTNPAILSLIPTFSEQFVPKFSCKGFPPPLKIT